MSDPSGGAPPLRLHRLDNGLTVVLAPDHSLPLVAVNVWYHVGSKDETPGRTGLAHLFEHMLFQGSAHLDTNDHFRFVQQVGGVANGSTWFDRTNYYETLPASELDLGLWLESDRMGFFLPALTTEKLENQRAVVLNERRERIENQPYGRAFEALQALIYPEAHPYSWPVIGWSPDIEGASIDDVSAFFRAYYSPANAVLTLAGDLDPDHALDRVEHFFADIPGIPRPPARQTPESLEPGGERRQTLPDAVPLTRLYLAARVPGVRDPAWPRLELAADALGGGKSSPLQRRLVYETPSCQSVSAFLLPTELEALFGVVATLRPGADTDAVRAEIEETLQTLAEAGPGPGDFERARHRFELGWASRWERLDSRADLLSEQTTFFGDPHRALSEIERRRAIGARDLREDARQWLRPERFASLEVAPGEAA